MTGDALAVRAGLYGLLRRLYTYPLTSDVLSGLADASVEPDLPGSTALEGLQGVVRARTLDDAAMTELNVEMTGLLEGPGVTTAPPYASYYLHDGQLMGPAAVAARRTYLEWEILPDGEARLPDDHVALQTGFLAHLATVASDVASSDPELARQALWSSAAFIDELVLPWLARFCNALSGATHDAFFVHLARLTIEAIRADRQRIDQALDALQLASASATTHRTSPEGAS